MKSVIIAAMIAGAATTGWADAPPSPAVRPIAADAEKLKCKRYVETGSLARVREECHTRARWDQLAAEGRANAFDMVGTIQGGSHVNDDPK